MVGFQPVRGANTRRERTRLGEGDCRKTPAGAAKGQPEVLAPDNALIKVRDAGLYTAVTDCGAGGFSSAVGEMAGESHSRATRSNSAANRGSSVAAMLSPAANA